MSKLTEEYLETTMEDDNGGEIDIRVYFHYSPAEPMEYVDGLAVYPGSFAEVTVESVEERTQYNLDVWGWYELHDYEESQAQAWEEEIMTMLSIAEEAE